jgi:CRISPR-associated exonuclease Cas4
MRLCRTGWSCCSLWRPQPVFEEGEPLPVSALNHLLYCERRCALIHIEGVFVENAYTLEGRMSHDTADTPGYETAAGVRSVRALPLYSRRYDLSGRADIVEFHRQAAGVERPYPVDYKRGKKSKWDNDDVQLCAQALCLEEMLSVDVPAGAIFHGASRRRREVRFTAGLRETTITAIGRLHDLFRRGTVPEAKLAPKCEGCSLHGICLPELSEHGSDWSSERRELFSSE